jgi:phospholipase D1/2
MRMPGHLIPYPIRVEDDGSITELPGAAMFPDTSAPVAGSKSTMLPMKLTT